VLLIHIIPIIPEVIMKKTISFKVICMLLAVLMTASVFSAVPAFAIKDQGEIGQCSWEFNSEDGKLTVFGKGHMNDYEYPKDFEWHEIREEIESIEIKEGVTDIGALSFTDCENLTSVTFPTTLKSIGACAFCNCHSLKSIAIPYGIEQINDSAFLGCSSVNAVYLPDSLKTIGKNAFGFDGEYNDPTAHKNFRIYASKDSAAAKYAAANHIRKTYLSVKPAEISLKAGKSKDLKLSGFDIDSYFTNDKYTAFIKNSKIYALKKGTAVTGAKLTDGAVITINVKVRNMPALKIKNKAFKATKTYKIKKGKTLKIKVSGKAAAVTNKYKSSKQKVARVISNKNATTIVIKGFKKGKTIVTIKVNGVKFKVNVKVK
jgi:hypothetical protein